MRHFQVTQFLDRKMFLRKTPTSKDEAVTALAPNEGLVLEAPRGRTSVSS
jgi:hypothetical protein